MASHAYDRHPSGHAHHHVEILYIVMAVAFIAVAIRTLYVYFS